MTISTRHKRRYAFLLMVGIALALSACNREESGSTGEAGRARGGDAPPSRQATNAPQVRTVEALLVSSGQFYGAIEASGIVRGIGEVFILSETSGKIERVHVRLGDVVSVNQVLVTLDDALERFAVLQAEDQVAVAEIEFSAVEQLFESGNSSIAERARIQASLSGARSALAQTKRQLNNRVIKSPINGSIAVLEQSVSPGNFIQPGSVIAKIVNLSRIRIDIGLGEREITLVKRGDAARVYIEACGGAPQNAFVSSVAAGSGNQAGTFTISVEFTNICGTVLKSGMSAQIEILNSDQQERIIIPSSAILKDDERRFVFVGIDRESDTIAEQRYITVVQILGERSEISDGLVEGELIILAPIQNLEDGDVINPQIIRSL